MSSSPKRIAAQRRLQFEEFEQRLVMSADAVAAPIVELLPEMELAAPAITGQDVVWQQSNQDTASTQAADIAAQYGLDGAGQTIAVIDSGIAWDHYAFGSGFGAGNHVVGGWDFAEDDANPYDDGPAGYHGSHVAGIIGSLDEQYQGVSSGADLVSLRVFDDAGVGSIEWVEEALQWVHDHQHDFEFPITTVNLSLGMGWNPENTPEWGQLDNELSALKADGIFISVAAGNYFKQINDVGLSYPAASEHVVPVASHDANGALSDFSQREQGVLVAPGEMLRSPVPDHLFGGTSQGQFLASSGTSMAAPYVAGVSAILREANWFMGQDQVNQATIFEQLRGTSDRVFDTATGLYYDRIDLSAALEHVITDHHAQSLADATDLNVIRSGDQIKGTIGRLDDIDAIKFTAAETGRITLSIDATHDLAPEFQMQGVNLSIDGNQIAFDVVAGQEYGFKVSTTAGTGHYEIAASYQAGSSMTPDQDLGVVANNHFSGMFIDGESIYQVTAIRDGFLTIEANAAQSLILGGPSSSPAPVTLEVYDAAHQLIGTTTGQLGDSDLRLDLNATAGQDYYLKLSVAGEATQIDLRVQNLVSLDQGQLTVHGTHENDAFEINHHPTNVSDGAGNTTSSTQSEARLVAKVNGIQYSFAESQIQHVELIGHAGQDSIIARLGDQDDQVATRSNRLWIKNASRLIRANLVEYQTVVGGGGYDTLMHHDTVGSEHFQTGMLVDESDAFWTSLQGDQFSSRASGFEVTRVASQGNDTASLVGTAGDDIFASRGLRHFWRLSDANIVIDGFDQVQVDGGGGHDQANLFDTSGHDQYTFSSGSGSVRNEHYELTLDDFDQLNGFSESGQDSIEFVGSTGIDRIAYRDGTATLNSSDFGHFGRGFASIKFDGRGGLDLAQLHDTQDNDSFTAETTFAELVTDHAQVTLVGVANIGFIADQGGFDRTEILGSQGADRVDATDRNIRVNRASGETIRIYEAEQSTIDLLTGVDHISLQGGSGRDKLDVGILDAEFESTLQMLRMTNYDRLEFDGGQGKDSVKVEGPIDLLASIGDQAKVVLSNKQLMLDSFSFLEANNVDDALAEYDLDSVDFTYMLRGHWDSNE